MNTIRLSLLVAVAVACSPAADTAEPSSALSPTAAEPPTTVVPSPTDAGPSGDCSAATMTAGELRTDVPAAAARTLHDIATAAVACDFDGLGEIAAASPMFVAPFGMDVSGAGEFADHWLRAERDDTPVTAVLVRLTGAPAASQIAQMPEAGDAESRQVEMLLLPAAFNDFDSPENRAQIAGLFGDVLGGSYVDDSFLDGAYLGWRLGVTADGDWVTFVSGD